MNRRKPVTKLLLVDDLEENLFALAALLRSDDLELLQARSGAAALELLLHHDVALALIDVQMPEMDGFELAELMRGAARTHAIPIVFVTAGARETHRVFQGYDAGAVDFLFKPVDSRILLNKVRTFVELSRQRQELAEMLRLNEELMAVVSHDLRNSLNVVGMVSQLLIESADVGVSALGKRLVNSGGRMKTIIDELFDLTRARLAGGIPVDMSPMDLLPTVRRVIAEIEASGAKQAIQLHSTGELRGSWDGARLEQVMTNLLGNALGHGDGTEPIIVRVDGSTADAVQIEITNVGVIPAELLPQIFEPFRSKKKNKKNNEGLGLGLYIVDQIVNAHGGCIEVTSTADSGKTTFSIRLPRAHVT